MIEILYLGHVIGGNGVQVHQEKIRGIIEWRTSKNVTELKNFPGICTYYRKFVKGFLHLIAHLTDPPKRRLSVGPMKHRKLLER